MTFLFVRNFNFTASSSPLYLDSDTSNTVTSSRQYSGPNGAAGNLQTGLVTGFNAVAVPEAPSWTITIGALVGLGFMAWRRKPRFTGVVV